MSFSSMSKKGEIGTLVLIVALGVMMIGGIIGSLSVRRDRTQINSRAQTTGCVDSDAPHDATKQDLYRAGQTDYNQTTEKDRCMPQTGSNPDKMVEYYCDAAGQRQVETVNCPSNTSYPVGRCQNDSQGRGYCLGGPTGPTLTPTMTLTPVPNGPTSTPTETPTITLTPTITTTPTPQPPRNLRGDCTTTAVTFRWDIPQNQSNLVGYSIAIKDLTLATSADSDYSDASLGTNTSYTRTELAKDHVYNVKVQTRYNPGGSSVAAELNNFNCSTQPQPTNTQTPTPSVTITPTPGTISGIVRLTWDGVQPQTATVYLRVWKMNTSGQIIAELPRVNASRRASDSSNNTYDYSFTQAFDTKYAMRAYASVSAGVYGNDEVDCAGKLNYYGCVVDKNTVKDFTVNITKTSTPTQSIPSPSNTPPPSLTPTPGDKTYQLDFIPNPTNSPNYPGRNCSVLVRLPLTGTPSVASITGELRDGSTVARVECQVGFEPNTKKLKAREVRLYLNQISTQYSLRKNVCGGLVNSCTTSVDAVLTNADWVIQHTNSLYNELNCEWDIPANTVTCTKQNVPNVTPGQVEGQQAKEIAKYDLNSDGVISIQDFQLGKQKWCYAGVRSNCALNISKLISVIGIKYKK